ncbi:Coronin-like protein crn1 [Psilocybe cubensis]|uniref:Coronin n=2 Tax=Psilocybe cubensis TaxID=181762 RepID=A0A8H7XVA7_PSICU|nr:Coronin-like protein crn1 [Psilocybe cubensis]KAH9479140.1 Coronin-like protein crn1 [Psilocybe cubensis]
MSRFVRASKYRHVFGQPAKKEHGIENVKVTNSAWDTNIISASAEYISVNWNASGGGAFAILPLPSPFQAVPGLPYKLPETIPLARSHTAAVLDTDWSPHHDSIVASGGEDGKVMIWKVEPSLFEGWGQEGWVAQDFDPVLRIDASPRKVGQVLFHPTAENVVASSSGEYTVKLWDLANPEDPRAVLTGHGDIVQSMSFNATGTLLATTSRDKKLRLFDPRVGGDPVRTNDGHTGIKGSRVAWMGEHDKIATTGFSKMSDRQVAIWETGGLGNVKTISLDQSAGVVMPFWTDNNILFLAGKGDGNIRYYEYESDSLFALSEHKSSEPQRGMCFLPRRSLNVAECEIARAYKVHGSSIEPIAFIVPRKADSFQSDIYPPAPSIEPSLSASEFFNGKVAPRKLVNLADGSTISGPKPSSVPTAAPVQSPIQPTRTFSAAAPSPAPLAVPPPSAVPAAEPSPVSAAPAQKSWAPSPSPAIESRTPSRSQTSDSKDSFLASENARLEGELREAREKIRNLELQVESIRANARKAAQALLDQ